MLFHHKIKLILKNKIPQNLVSEFNFDYTNSIKWGMVRFEYGKLKNIYTIMTIKKIQYVQDILMARVSLN